MPLHHQHHYLLATVAAAQFTNPPASDRFVLAIVGAAVIQGYDVTYIGLATIMTLICFGIFWAFLGLLIWVVFPQKYARPLRQYSHDIALNREGTPSAPVSVTTRGKETWVWAGFGCGAPLSHPASMTLANDGSGVREMYGLLNTFNAAGEPGGAPSPRRGKG
eukprot:180991-Chlamydomonas_euryale.AAC.1